MNSEELEDEEDIDIQWQEKIQLFYKAAERYLSEETDHKSDLERVMNQVHHRYRKQMEQCMRSQKVQEEGRMSLERIIWKKERIEEELEQLGNCETKYHQLLLQKKKEEEDVTALDFAMKSLQELTGKMHDQFGKTINDKISEYISLFTNGKYDTVYIDENAQISVYAKGQMIPLYQLSVGTMYQIYLAFRLVVGEEIFGYKDEPILLDEYFAYFDEERLKETMLALEKRKQIIIFTCQTREQATLEALEVPYNLIYI